MLAASGSGFNVASCAGRVACCALHGVDLNRPRSRPRCRIE
jgi:hypothetical protein